MVIDLVTNVISWPEIDRLLLCCWRLLLIVHTLINRDVHLFNQNAIGWYAISLVDVYDVAHNQVPHRNTLYSSESATVHSDILVVDLILKLQELVLLDPVA